MQVCNNNVKLLVAHLLHACDCKKREFSCGLSIIIPTQCMVIWSPIYEPWIDDSASWLGFVFIFLIFFIVNKFRLVYYHSLGFQISQSMWIFRSWAELLMTKIFGNPLYIKENYVEFYIGPQDFLWFLHSGPPRQISCFRPCFRCIRGKQKMI